VIFILLGNMQQNQGQSSESYRVVFMIRLLKSENVTLGPALVSMQNSSLYYKIKIQSKA